MVKKILITSCTIQNCTAIVLFCTIDRNGNIIVADRGNKLIKLFSPSGQFLYKLGEGEDEGFTSPCHCIQNDKYLIVSDNG